jgi:hypothetical protein
VGYRQRPPKLEHQVGAHPATTIRARTQQAVANGSRGYRVNPLRVLCASSRTRIQLPILRPGVSRKWQPARRGSPMVAAGAARMLARMEPVEQVEPVAWCQCCRDADCQHHMGHVEVAVECVVCGKACQCVGCAANIVPRDSGD